MKPKNYAITVIAGLLVYIAFGLIAIMFPTESMMITTERIGVVLAITTVIFFGMYFVIKEDKDVKG